MYHVFQKAYVNRMVVEKNHEPGAVNIPTNINDDLLKKKSQQYHAQKVCQSAKQEGRRSGLSICLYTPITEVTTQPQTLCTKPGTLCSTVVLIQTDQ